MINEKWIELVIDGESQHIAFKPSTPMSNFEKIVNLILNDTAGYLWSNECQEYIRYKSCDRVEKYSECIDGCWTITIHSKQ